MDGTGYTFYSKYSDYANIFTLPVLVTAEIDSVCQTSVWGRILSVNAGAADIRNLRYSHYDHQADSIVYLPVTQGSQVFLNGLRNHKPLLYDIYDRSGEAAVMQSVFNGDTILYDIANILKPVSFIIQPATNVSRTSATLNAFIECDTYSDSKFGFVWGIDDKGHGIRDDVHITYGMLQPDGKISVPLPSEDLLPDTTYCYYPFVEHGENNYTTPDYGEYWGYFKTSDPELERIDVAHGSADLRLETSDGRITLLGAQNAIVEVFDMQGCKVWSGQCKQKRQDVIVASGIYIVNINNKNKMKVQVD